MAVVVEVGQQHLHEPAAGERRHRHPGQVAAVVAPVAAVGGLHDIRPAVAGDVADHLVVGVAAGRPQHLPGHHVLDATVVEHDLEVAAAGDVGERAIALAGVLLAGEPGQEAAGAAAVAVARAHGVAMARPVILAAVAIEVEHGQPARSQRVAAGRDVVVDLAVVGVGEGAGAVAAVQPQAAGRAPVGVREDEGILAAVVVEVDEQGVEPVVRIEHLVDALRGLVLEGQRPGAGSGPGLEAAGEHGVGPLRGQQRRRRQQGRSEGKAGADHCSSSHTASGLRCCQLKARAVCEVAAQDRLRYMESRAMR